MFMVLLTGAWLFDHFHQGEITGITPSQTTGTGTASENPCFYGTPQATLVFKSPVLKNSHSRIFREKLNMMVIEQLNARSVFLRKAETLKQPNSRFISRNLISYRYHFLHFPDDQPPV